MSASPRLLDFAPARRKRATVSILTWNGNRPADGWALPGCPGLCLAPANPAAPDGRWRITHASSGRSVSQLRLRLTDALRLSTFLASRARWDVGEDAILRNGKMFSAAVQAAERLLK